MYYLSKGCVGDPMYICDIVPHAVVYAIRAAIFNAYQKRANLTGCVLYTTLYPSNVCAQCIRDAGIAEVFYISDKFHDCTFMEASRRIMEGIKCR